MYWLTDTYKFSVEMIGYLLTYLLIGVISLAVIAVVVSPFYFAVLVGGWAWLAVLLFPLTARLGIEFFTGWTA